MSGRKTNERRGGRMISYREGEVVADDLEAQNVVVKLRDEAGDDVRPNQSGESVLGDDEENARRARGPCDGLDPRSSRHSDIEDDGAAVVGPLVSLPLDCASVQQ